ncbi:glycosyltransferase [Candidatus Parcubacteria bacterium]|nr:glycosyltransferase [Candidatus Parcubacteria bacterium]
MKICLINNLYKPYIRGGAERVVELTLQGLNNAGHDVFIISTTPNNNEEKKVINNNFNQYFIYSKYYNLSKIPLFFRVFWHIWDVFDFITAQKIKNILVKEKPDLIITHNLKGLSFLIPKYIKKLEIKYIHVLHDVQLFYPSGLMMYKEEYKTKKFFVKTYSKICSYLFNSVDKVISPSNWLMNEYIERGFFRNSKKEIIPNPISINNNINFKKDNKEKFRFLYVGLLESHKGVENMLKQFLKLRNSYNNIEIFIVGNGSQDKYLREKFKHEKIIFLGRKDKESVKKIMFNSDCLITPSRCYENSPTVIYEAVSANLFTIASNLGGSIELINEFGGKLFSYNIENDLFIKMKEFLDSREEFEYKKTDNFIENCSVGNYIKKLLN